MKIGIDSEIQGTSVPVRWCLSRDELNKLAETGEKAYILLLVVSDTGKDCSETRYLIPVAQMMEYINFYIPGEHKIFATVMWGKHKGEDINLRKRFLSRESCGYSRSLYDYDEKKLYERGFNFKDFGVHKFGVNVPKEIFAKEPPAWEKSWVNWFYEGKPKDQCYYRRRRLFAYSIQPLLVLFCFFALEIATLFITGALLMVGTKGIGFRKIIHPLMESFASIWDKTDGSVFGRRLILRLSPSIFLGSSVISWATCKILGVQILGKIGLLEAIIMGGVAVGAVVAVSGFIYLSYYGIIKAIDAIDKIRNAIAPGAEERKEQKRLRAEAIEKERSRKFRERIEVEYALLACNGNLSANMRTLPPEKRTIYLRYKDLKSRICKSFAR